jgi:serine/threonine-protein kinase
LDADVAELVRAERLVEAAQLASARGDPALACKLYDRACAWALAAREALRAGDRRRAMELAAESGDEGLCTDMAAQLASDPALAAVTAAGLEGRGRDRWAAVLFEGAGRNREAAQAWERAGLPLRAAALLEKVGDPAAAARILEAACRREPAAWPVVVALGTLLARFGKTEAAVRTLQRVPADDPWRTPALAQLVPALDRLGLERASADAEAELRARGAVADDTTPEPEPARGRGRLFGRYDVVSEVASSPTARVLECTDVVRGDRVAVKIFAARDARGAGRDALARFEREARAMRALDHPNVVPLRDFLPDGPAIVLEWMAGGTLDRLLSSTGALAPARAAEIATSVLGALAEAHRLGILHRDVKPSNILFEDAGGARLGDFGVAHLGDATTTATAGVFGTIAYMSPEQREGRAASVQSDLFSVGVVFAQMIAGRSPGAGEASTAPSAVHRDLDERHDEIVARLTATDPAQRPRDAVEARALLLSVPWPTTLDARAERPPSMRRASAWPAASRLAIASDGGSRDTWTERPIVRLPMTAATMARARAFAKAGHPALQTVLRVDRSDGTVWLEAPAGAPLQTRLDARQRAILADALRSLHAAGGVHGHVDAAHVRLRGDEPVLSFDGETDATATADRDFLALARI